MNLNEVATVMLELGDSRKFIVARLTDADWHEKIVFRAQRRVLAHLGLVLDLQDEVEKHQVKVWCIGGGHMLSSVEAKTISITGHSQDYRREPDRAATVAMLKEAYPGFTISSD